MLNTSKRLFVLGAILVPLLFVVADGESGSSILSPRDDAAESPSPKILTGRAVAITDGDTLSVLDMNKRVHRIRLLHIDTPESRQDFGTQAKKALSGKVFGKDVRVEWTGKDRYGRTLGNIFYEGRWINKELVEEGFAWHYRQYSNDKQMAAEKRARTRKLGLWSHKNPIPPWNYRRGVRQVRETKPPLKKVPTVESPSTQTVFKTRTGRKYHRVGCRYLRKSRIPISLDEAKSHSGPCSVCKPPR